MPKPASPIARAEPAPSRAAATNRTHLRTIALAVAALGMALAAPVPAGAVKLVDAPPPPPMPEVSLERDGTPQKLPSDGTLTRGQMLYENHCTSCHDSVAHIRDRHAVRSLPELQREVGRWADHSKLQWGKEEVEDVVRFLNIRHYRF